MIVIITFERQLKLFTEHHWSGGIKYKKLESKIKFYYHGGLNSSLLKERPGSIP